MPNTAFVFPGQGSQTADMRQLVERYRPELIDLARDELGDLPFSRAGDATEFAQPAIYCASLAAHTAHELAGGAPAAAMAGHSLGEISALTAAGAIRADEGLRLVVLRARLMQRCCETHPGAMVAVLGETAERAADLARTWGLTVANDNCPQQVVLSGDAAAVERLLAGAPDGTRLKRLPVAGAFHSPAMASAEPELRAALDAMTIRTPRVPVLSGLTAQPFTDVRAELARALTSPVRWREVVLTLHAMGVTEYLEMGPGKVLKGLVKRTLRDAPSRSEAALV